MYAKRVMSQRYRVVKVRMRGFGWGIMISHLMSYNMSCDITKTVFGVSVGKMFPTHMELSGLMCKCATVLIKVLFSFRRFSPLPFI